MSRTFGDQDVEDLLHDAFLMVVRSIRQGELRDPLRLFGFIHAIMRRHIATVIEKLVLSRTKVADAEWTGRVEGSIYDPEEEFVLRERGRLIREVFSALGDREREVLRRFYLEEQSIGEICRDMRLSETQFRLLKSRAKARFGELGRRRQAPIRRAA
ncbi:MAG: sigma-70 family RNA polymerase sigma factor [Acidobacteria bacterium]|nr:sigma-70 family RNA polymerase sigma factor [Acidobacteriota bacterium]